MSTLVSQEEREMCAVKVNICDFKRPFWNKKLSSELSTIHFRMNATLEISVKKTTRTSYSKRIVAFVSSFSLLNSRNCNRKMELCGKKKKKKDVFLTS